MGDAAECAAGGVCLAALLCAGLYAAHLARWVTLPGLDAWEAATEDARARLAGAREPLDDRIVIVGLDDRTHREAPDLFQKRRGVARLLDAVAAQKPAVIGLDMFFAQPELQLDPAVVEQVRGGAGPAGRGGLHARLGALPRVRARPAPLSPPCWRSCAATRFSPARSRRPGRCISPFCSTSTRRRRAQRFGAAGGHRAGGPGRGGAHEPAGRAQAAAGRQPHGVDAAHRHRGGRGRLRQRHAGRGRGAAPHPAGHRVRRRLLRRARTGRRAGRVGRQPRRYRRTSAARTPSSWPASSLAPVDRRARASLRYLGPARHVSACLRGRRRERLRLGHSARQDRADRLHRRGARHDRPAVRQRHVRGRGARHAGPQPSPRAAAAPGRAAHRHPPAARARGLHHVPPDPPPATARRMGRRHRRARRHRGLLRGRPHALHPPRHAHPAGPAGAERCPHHRGLAVHRAGHRGSREGAAALGVLALRAAGRGRAHPGRSVARAAGRRAARADGPVLRHPRLLALGREPGAGGPVRVPQRVPDADDRPGARRGRDARQVHRRRADGGLRRAARGGRPRGARLPHRAGHAGRARAGSTPSSRAAACPRCRSASASTAGRCRSATWDRRRASTTRCSATRSTSARGWRRSPASTGSTSWSARTPPSWSPASFAFRELDTVRVKGRAGVGRIHELCGPNGARALHGRRPRPVLDLPRALPRRPLAGRRSLAPQLPRRATPTTGRPRCCSSASRPCAPTRRPRSGTGSSISW